MSLRNLQGLSKRVVKCLNESVTSLASGTEDSEDWGASAIDLSRQAVADLMRATASPGNNVTYEGGSEKAVAETKLGVPEAGGDNAGLVGLKVEVDGSVMRFYVNDKKVGECNRNLDDYPQTQIVVQKAIEAARGTGAEKAASSAVAAPAALATRAPGTPY